MLKGVVEAIEAPFEVLLKPAYFSAAKLSSLVARDRLPRLKAFAN
jgi:hypothetical protein